MRTLKQRLQSRKLWMTLLAALAGFLRVYCPDFPADALEKIVLACLGYVAAETVVDAAGQLAGWAVGRAKKKAAE